MIKEKILKLIKEITGDDQIDYDASLISGGILDSFSILILVSKIESEFNVKIEIRESGMNDLDTINKISEYITNKQLNS
mgnify:CR=1 FL=1